MQYNDALAIGLRAKIGQLFILGFEGKYIDEHSAIAQSIMDDNLGGVILFDIDYQTKKVDKNIESPSQVKQLNQTLQTLANYGNKKHQRQALPLFISVDYEGGLISRLKSDYGFKETLSAEQLAQCDDTAIQQHLDTMSTTLMNAGFNLSYSPLLDLKINPNNPVIAKLKRSFSADPEKVARLSRFVVSSLNQHNIVASYKHFPGHGSSNNDSHLGFVDVTNTWQASELTPYKKAFEQLDSYAMVMSAHIINKNLDPSGLPATLSQPILIGLLRQELGFSGVIVSDDMQMKAISDHYGMEQALVMAINAGVDLFIYGNQLLREKVNVCELIDIVERNIKSGQIAITTIEQSYQRIMALKQSLLPV